MSEYIKNPNVRRATLGLSLVPLLGGAACSEVADRVSGESEVTVVQEFDPFAGSDIKIVAPEGSEIKGQQMSDGTLRWFQDHISTESGDKVLLEASCEGDEVIEITTYGGDEPIHKRYAIADVCDDGVIEPAEFNEFG